MVTFAVQIVSIPIRKKHRNSNKITGTMNETKTRIINGFLIPTNDVNAQIF